MRYKQSRRSTATKKASDGPVTPPSPPVTRKRDSVDDVPVVEKDDDDESKVELDITPMKKKRRVAAPGPATNATASSSEIVPKKGRGRPRKHAVEGPAPDTQEALQVEVEELAEYIPSIDELENRAIYKSYNKLKVGTDGSKPGFSPEDMTFAVGDTCVLRRPADIPQQCDEWICRIERIRAEDANNVYCVIRWFYTPTQATQDLRLPKSLIKDVGCDEIFASDHLEVVDVLAVDAHVEVNFGPKLKGDSEYNYIKKVVLGTLSKKATVVAMKGQLSPPDSTAKVTLS